MTRRQLFALLLVMMLLLPVLPSSPAHAQDPTLTLPADLYALTSRGQVMRIDVGGTFGAAVTPVGQTVVDFAPAADGQWIAYRTVESENSGAFIGISSIDGQSGQLLESDIPAPPIEGRGQTMAWSPDGTSIVYTVPDGIRAYQAGLGENGGPLFIDLAGGPFLSLLWSPGSGYLAAEAENNVWWIYRREGANIVYAGQIPGSAGAAWLREGVLALAPPTGSLLTLDVTNGTQAALIGAETFVSQPAMITGDRVNFFVHESTGQRFAARKFGTVSTLGGDFQEFEAALELTPDMRWTPDGVALTAVIDGALTIIEPRTNTRREIMEGIKAYTWGAIPPEEISGMVLPSDVYFISRDDGGVPQLWRLPADGRSAEQVTIEPSAVLDYAVSPDGTQIAYTSGATLVVANRDGSAGRELSPVVERPGGGAQPDWNRGGQLLAYVRDGMWMVPAIGGARSELVIDNFDQSTPPSEVRVYMNPRFSPDGLLLLLDIGYYEGAGLGIMPITGGAPIPLNTEATIGDWTPDNKVLSWDYGIIYARPGLYLSDPANLNTYTTILDEAWSVVDAVALRPEAAIILRSPSGDTMGPSVVQPFLVPILPNAIPIPQGQGGLLQAARLSPDGAFAVGLRDTAYSDYGLAGKLAIINLQTGEQYAITTPGEIWAVGWDKSQ